MADSARFVTHLNPAGLPRHRAFSQAVVVQPGAHIVYIGGQNGVDEVGRTVGQDPYAQAQRALGNVRIAIEAAGGTIADIVAWTIVVTDRAHLEPGFAAFGAFWAGRPDPPAISVQIVAGLADPDWLVEIEAVAAIAP